MSDEVIKEAKVDIDPKDAEKIMDVLKAFPTFKKPKQLPDHLQLTKKQVARIMRWSKEAKENSANPTFSGLRKTAFGARRTFSDLTLFGQQNQQKGPDEKKTETINEEKEMEKEDVKVEEEEEEEEEEEATLYDTSDDESFDEDDFEKMFSGGMGNLFGGLGTQEGMGNLFTDMFTERGQEKETKTGQELGGMFTNMLGGLSGMVPTMMAMVDKSVAYEPCKATYETLGPWIEESRGILTPQQIAKKEKQLALYKEMIELYDEEKEDDEQYIKEARGERVMQLMQEAELCGPLPKEVELAANEAQVRNQGNMADNLPKQMEMMGNMMTNMMSSMFTGGPGATSGGDQPPRGPLGGEQSEGDCTIL